jgi:hypothetical protein
MGRKRPSVSLAKPADSSASSELDDYVHSDEPDARPHARRQAARRQPDKRDNMRRTGRDGSKLARVNAWVPAKLAERLNAYVLQERREKGAVVGDALEMLFKQLGGKGVRAPVGAR